MSRMQQAVVVVSSSADTEVMPKGRSGLRTPDFLTRYTAYQHVTTSFRLVTEV